MKSIELRTTTMTSMVRLAIMTLMPFRDLRFLSICFFAHFTMLIFLSHSTAASGFLRKVSKKPGSSNQVSRPVPSSPHLTAVKTNWLLRDVTTVTVYELTDTKVQVLPWLVQVGVGQFAPM